MISKHIQEALNTAAASYSTQFASKPQRLDSVIAGTGIPHDVALIHFANHPIWEIHNEDGCDSLCLRTT